MAKLTIHIPDDVLPHDIDRWLSDFTDVAGLDWKTCCEPIFPAGPGDVSGMVMVSLTGPIAADHPFFAAPLPVAEAN